MSSSGNKDNFDDRIVTAGGTRGLSRFALIHLSSHFASIANLTSYFVHYVLYGDAGLPSRAFLGGAFELFLVLVRFANEYAANKIGSDDYVHHLVHLIAATMVMTRDDCSRYTFLLTRMNILHFPCFLYYWACRRNGASYVNCYVRKPILAQRMGDIARIIFPCMFIAAAGFRVGSMLNAAAEVFIKSGYQILDVPFLTLLVFGLVLLLLDISWSRFFLNEVDYPQMWYKTGGFSKAFMVLFTAAAATLGVIMSVIA